MYKLLLYKMNTEEKENLLNSINKIINLSDKYKEYIFSDNEDKRTIAELREEVINLKRSINLDNVKTCKLKEDSLAYRNIKNSLQKPQFVRIRPCTDNPEKKTYLGIHIGEIALGFSTDIKGNTMTIEHSCYNIAFFVPEIKRIVLGCESWWKKSDVSLKEITDEEIRNTLAILDHFMNK